jgi:hypothetical protein
MLGGRQYLNIVSSEKVGSHGEVVRDNMGLSRGQIRLYHCADGANRD